MPSRYSSLSLLLILAGLLAAPVPAAQPQPLTAETLWEIARPSAATISPDGATAVFSLTRYSMEENASHSNLYRVDIASGEYRQLTWRNDADSQPAFSPDGRKLAFVSRRGNDQAQLFVMPVDGGEARQLTDLPVAVTAPRWFPDGRRIAFSAQVMPGYGGDFEKLAGMIAERAADPVQAHVTENRTYRFWDRWLTHGDYPRLFVLDLESGEITDLMPGSRRFFTMLGGPQYDIAPDGRTLAVSANAAPPPYEHLNFDIFLVPADGSGELVNLTADNPAHDVNPVFSPDGRSLIYGAQSRTDFYADNVKLYRHELSGGRVTALAADLDTSPQNWQFSADGRTLYFHAAHRAKVSLFALDLRRDRVEEIFRGGSNSAVRVAGDRLVFNHDSMNQPPELFTVDSRGRGPRPLTSFNQSISDGTAWGRVENVSYPGANGAEVQMYIVYPPDFDESRSWPLLNLIHGGPHGIFGDQFHFRWNAQLFAAPGYVVIMPNFHGSSSFGQAFTESIHGAHADLPFRDTQKAVDYMLEHHPYIDPERKAAAGASYGGYLVSWIAGHTDRYRTLINHAGVYNIMTQFSADTTHHREAAYSGAPWDGLDSLNRWNPAMFAENFVTPMLIIHGERDYRVPISHGLEIYGVYKGKGLDARLVYYPDENHWILKPRNSVHWFGEIFDWLDRWIGAGPGG